MKVVLDADVVIGALDGNDPHHTRARTLFRGWERQEADRLLSVVNLGEVLVAPAADRRLLLAAREAIAALGIAVHQPGEAVGVDAARLRGAHPISLPDAYCLATARSTNAAVASFDEKVLRAAEREGLTLVGTAARRPGRKVSPEFVTGRQRACREPPRRRSEPHPARVRSSAVEATLHPTLIPQRLPESPREAESPGMAPSAPATKTHWTRASPVVSFALAIRLGSKGISA